MQDKRSPLQILQTIYGYQNFRGQQEEIINHIIEGKNAFVLMPTGSGKSLCYQIPSLCMDGVGIIISPLIALMHDQVSALNQLGIKAVAINSGLSYSEVCKAPNYDSRRNCRFSICCARKGLNGRIS